MLLQGNLVAVARGEISKKKKKPCTFINSFFGKRDADGLFLETTAVDCWLPAEEADKLKFGMTVKGLLDVNGDFVMLREFTLNNQVYIVGEDKIANLKTAVADEKKSKA